MSLKKVIHKGRTFSVLSIPNSNIFKLEITNHKGTNVYGGSHLIEHLGFKASRDYETEELMTLLKQNGSYNANTNYERINYYYLTSMDNWKLGVDLITNVTFNDFSKITDEEYEKERDVVYNEVKRYFDSPQNIFYFDITKTIYGYDPEDTILGTTESVANLQLDDLKSIKSMFLNEADHTYSIVYDPAYNLDEILDYVSAVVDSYSLASEFPMQKEFEDCLTHEFKRENADITSDAEQTMVSYVYEPFASPYISGFMGSYVSSLAPNISLTDYIREKNGLTYGVSFYTSESNGNHHVMFGCDVTEGNEDLLLSLYKQSIKECAETFDEENYNKFISKKKLNTSIAMLDKKVVMGYTKDMFINGEYWEEVSEFFAEDASEAPFKIIESMTYEKCKDYLDKLNELTSTDKFKIIRGTKNNA